MGNCSETNWGIVLKLIGELFWNYLGIFAGTRHGVNLTDVWSDIPPVRHWKFKSKKRATNQLSTKLLERIVLMSTNACDTVLDPFGGSGTTYDVCERFQRHWIGIELESYDVIIERLENADLSPHKSDDYVEG